MTLQEITQKLKSDLNESRFNHSISVANTAKELAVRFGADENKAYIAGLVHDCAKCLSTQELKEKVETYGIETDADTFNSTQLLHSFVGAYKAREDYGIYDDEIFDAIYYHTVGKKNMPPITSIVYLADAIEPLRSYPGVDEIRKQAQTSLDKAIYMYTKDSVDFILKKGCYLHPNSVETRDYYSQK